MTYVSLNFALFVLILLIVYYCTPRKWQWIVLFLGSVVFYAFSGAKYLLYVLVSAAVTFTVAAVIDRSRDKFEAALPDFKASHSEDEIHAAIHKHDRLMSLLLTAAVLINLGILIVLKYLDFILTTINSFLPAESALPLFSFILPLGLSFYTFSSVGYVVDVSRGKYHHEKNFAKFFLYLTYFPHIIQGPIPRYDQLAHQLYEGHAYDFGNIRSGFELVLWGVFKKLVIADNIAAIVSAMLGSPDQLSGSELWIGMAVWGIQLYADFSGGIDVSRGVSEMLGIELDLNFKRPYFALNLTDYWNRWHISLGNWLKDYFFYPVAFSASFTRITKATKRKFGKFISKTVPVGILSLILFTIIGIWHGADWGEVLFGVFNGLVILISTLLEPSLSKLRKKLKADGRIWFRIFCAIRTFIIITLARVISLPSTISISWGMYAAMLGFGSNGISFGHISDTLLASNTLLSYLPAILGCLLLFAVSLIEEKGHSVRTLINSRPLWVRVVIASVGTVAIILFGAYGIGYNASNFIYSNY